MSTKFTPGPWRTKGPYYAFQYWNSFGRPVPNSGKGGGWDVRADKFKAICGGTFCDFEEEEAAANAHLIASAPQLYEALHNALSLLSCFVDDRTDDLGHAVLSECRDALKAARGEA